MKPKLQLSGSSIAVTPPDRVRRKRPAELLERDIFLLLAVMFPEETVLKNLAHPLELEAYRVEQGVRLTSLNVSGFSRI